VHIYSAIADKPRDAFGFEMYDAMLRSCPSSESSSPAVRRLCVQRNNLIPVA